MANAPRPPIRFRFEPRKALAAVSWMLRQAPPAGLDLHTILKACYFADRDHLNEYGRPIFGARYRAMNYGPVPVEIYEMLKGEPYYLAELDDAGGSDYGGYPWRLEGFRVMRQTDTVPDTDYLSRSDTGALERGFSRSRSMTFNERTAATHGEDWRRARMGWIDYRDMVEPENPRRAEILADLEEDAARYAL